MQLTSKYTVITTMFLYGHLERLQTSFLLRQDGPGAINYEKAAPGHEVF